ncbi:BnaAnng21910D [Brassica napus]|uniref:BnaAnng21910D protein n=1 Tax=Brassica napus TaxID=3708 RepID=A0A078JKD4_BRANA|nr:BnaAnng21910D [Brassica napus]
MGAECGDKTRSAIEYKPCQLRI